MNIQKLIYTGIILFPFFMGTKAKAQQSRERHRSVTINQTVVDGKVISSDTIITYTDTTTRTINSKEVSMELPYTKGTFVAIENVYRKINIRQAKDNKVRLVTTAFYYGEPTLTNEQWMEKLKIKMEKSEKGILISSGTINQVSNGSSSWSSNANDAYSFDVLLPPTPPMPPINTKDSTRLNIRLNETLKGVNVNGNKLKGLTTTQNDALKDEFVNGWWGNVNESRTVRGYASSGGNSTAVFDEKGNNVYNSSNLRRELTIYIPEGAKLSVESKYGNIVIDYDVADLSVVINNAALEMLNAKKLTVSSSYGNISVGNVEDATVEIKNGKLSMKTVGNLLADTRYTQIEADKIGTLKIQSISDDYDIDEIKSLSGTKSYGKFRLDKLTGSFDLKGSSADMKIKNIEPSVSVINLDNKYADVQLPVGALKNYEVNFSGNYSNVFAPFERRDTTIEKPTEKEDAYSYTTSNGTVVSKTKPGIAPAAQNGTVQRNDDNRVIYTTTDGSVISALRSNASSRRNGQSFTATVGDTKGIHTIFKLVCNSCNVDFK